MMDAESYLRQLQALLPPGAAWPREDSATLTQTLWALAAEFARVDGRAATLRDEADPLTTFELLIDWERAFGLPAPCMDGVSQTLQQRRNALVAQVTGIGDQSRQYFIDLAASAGFSISITEFEPWNVGMAVNLPIYGTLWRFAWQVNAPETTVEQFTVLSGVGEALQSWGNELLECLISRLKPAHTTVLFAYS
jgi:uncharacterized protein YmfQ (DUF2313 family)